MATKRKVPTKRSGTKRAAKPRAVPSAYMAGKPALDLRTDIYKAEHLIAIAADHVLMATGAQAEAPPVSPLTEAQAILVALRTLRNVRGMLVDAAERVMQLHGGAS